MEIHGDEYRFLGTDAEVGHHHFYRFTPEYAEVALVSEGEDSDYHVDDHWRLDQGDPEHILQEYLYSQAWEETEEVVGHDYRSLSDPEFTAEINSGLGGTFLLDDGSYVVPARLQFGKLPEILDHQTSENDILVDYRPQYIELAPEDSLEKYQLAPALRGDNEVTGTRILDEILILDRGSEQVYQSFQVDELAEDHFVEQLADVESLSLDDAAWFIDEYSNLRTASWALTSDTEFVEQETGYQAEDLFREFGEAGVYRNENSSEAGVLHFPERRAEELSEAKQQKYFDEIKVPQSSDDEEAGEESVGEQAGLSDF
ncbi:hypothetical protein ACM16X_02445 [Haloarcula japonica]|uniref:hypothetical protein n=1 Tax=Haloarcula japonica TaxID=29282 RepID=UPI0039F6C086